MRTVYRVFMLLVLVSSLSLSLVPQSASATEVQPLTASCSGNGCNNLDPFVTQCEDSSTVTMKEFLIQGAAGTPDAGTLGDIELRYSPTCGTNWARLTSFVGNAKTLATIERLEQPGISYLKWCFPESCYAASLVDHPNPPYTSWTNMVYSPTTPARACGTVVSLTTGRPYKSCVTL